MITFHQLATNPAGKGSAQIANRGIIINDLKNRAKAYGSVKGIQMDVYKKGDSYLLFFRLKSSHWQDLWYDTVLEISPGEDIDPKIEKTIAQYNVKFISNMPSFAFTYAYVANEQGNVVEFLKKKFNKIFWEQKPVVRNPSFSMGFEKAILLCVYYMTENRYQYIATLDKLSKGIPNIPVIAKKFMSFDEKMKDYEKKMREHRAKRIRSGVHMTKKGLKRLKTPKEAKESKVSLKPSKRKESKRSKSSKS